jgi:hypothetical protein
MTFDPSRLRRSLRSVGLLLLLLGALALWIFYLGPARGASAARAWKETPCRMVSIERTLRKGKRHHTKVDLEVLYEYVVEGRTYQSSRYRFGGHVEDPEALQAFGNLRSGRSTTCWVNPTDPADAVLLQGFTPKRADVAFAVSCLLAGAGLLSAAWLLARRAPLPPAGS